MRTNPFLRVGEHLINLEAITQVTLRKDRSAVLLLQGPKKSLQQVSIPAPTGAEVWEFVRSNLVVIEFGANQPTGGAAETTPAAKAPKPPKSNKVKAPKTKDSKPKSKMKGKPAPGSGKS